MPPFAERVALRLASRGFVAVLIVLAAIPAYLTLAPSWRPLASRMACAAVVMVVCVRVVRSVRIAFDTHTPSALETPVPPARAPELDERFVRLRDELVFSVRSRRYFEGILAPQLDRLAGAALPPPPPRRGVRRDGPSLSALAELVTAVETRA